MLFKVNGDIVVEAGNLAFAGDTTAIGDGTVTKKFGRGYMIEAANVFVAAGSSINSDGMGFPKAAGPGAGANGSANGNGDNRGAGYGGEGAYRVISTGRGMPYGTATAPTALGSGGGHSSSGSGGGALKLVVSGLITIDGRLSANGGNGTLGWACGGSGGSIWIVSGTLQGGGVIAANSGYSSISWRGGGGRMLIRYAGDADYTFTGTISVDGGNALEEQRKGQIGTLQIQNTLAVNIAPAAPVAVYPEAGDTMHAPYLSFLATDADGDFMRFKVEVATDAAFNDIVRTIDQTASQDLWRGQTEQTYTAYPADQIATVVIAPPLAANSMYYWRAYAIDPDGANVWSDPSTAQSFTTFPSEANWWVCDPNIIFGDRKWETAANWSTRSVPLPGEAVRFGGDYFNIDCMAVSVSNNLASLTLATNFTKVVTFAANAVEGGQTLSLSGDLSVGGGAFVLKGDTSAVGSGTPTVKHGAGYRVEVANVVVGSSGAFHADGCGFPYSQGPGEGSGTDNGRGAGYGGRGGNGSDTNLWYSGAVYGTNLMPSALGSGGGHNYNPNPLSGSGGGAIWIVASGQVSVDGRISADGADSQANWASGASGGTLLISADDIKGVGLIASRGASVPATPSAISAGGGGGGRICFVFGDESATRMNILEGDFIRARFVDEIPTFGGAVSVAPGTGYYNDEVHGAQAGTITYIRAIPPPGTIIMIR